MYRITAFAIRGAAAVIGRQSTVQAQITHTRRLSRPTYTARVCVTLRSAVRTHITCGGLLLFDWRKLKSKLNRNRIICKKIESKSIETKKMTIVTALPCINPPRRYPLKNLRTNTETVNDVSTACLSVCGDNYSWNRKYKCNVMFGMLVIHLVLDCRPTVRKRDHMPVAAPPTKAFSLALH